MAELHTHSMEGHRERLRERFRRAGLDGFHDYEVIELLLTLATPRKDCKPAAKAALERFGSLPAVLEATPRELCEVAGIGPRNLLGLKLIPAVCERYLAQRVQGQVPLNNSRDLFDYLYQSMRDKKREQFKAVFLDARNRVIGVQTLFEGSLTGSHVYPREVVRAALDHHAAAVIFAHNHPSGDPRPSPEDTALTRKLMQACLLMDITVHEHIIIGSGTYYSYADSGLIQQMRGDAQPSP
ncbi:MAG: DNA repair protein RadC [Desulfobacterales bacterium]|nr:DNA repair protein RadC [Desulfobacterales bacterium]MDJ0883979.1 DNA repair protein RadC [Desulfobacterales bacterium]